MEYVFLLNSCTQPRCHKRIRSFIDLGYTVKVYSFDRNWYSVNKPVDFDIEILADISSGSYMKRLYIYFKALSPIFKKHGKKCIYYCFGNRKYPCRAAGPASTVLHTSRRQRKYKRHSPLACL